MQFKDTSFPTSQPTFCVTGATWINGVSFRMNAPLDICMKTIPPLRILHS